VPNPVNLLLRNTAATVLGRPKASTEGRVMQFRVSATAPVDTSYNPATRAPIRSAPQQIVRLADPVAGTLAPGVTANLTRELTLNEVPGVGGPLEALINNSKWVGVRPDGTPIPGATLVTGNYLTELLAEGDTEVWEIVNTTMDSHPIHLHGLQFQLVNRQPYDAVAFTAGYAAAFPGGVYIPGYGPPQGYDPASNPLSGGKYGGNPDITPYLMGLPLRPLSFEAGWKDTVIMRPGEVTRIAVRVAPQDKAIAAADLFWPYEPAALGGAYVWHCHITDHEDNEMMRPDQFLSNPVATRTYVQGVDY
jgi:FtsP/CotA-like multicopper oxidase with cupredoxin domain